MSNDSARILSNAFKKAKEIIKKKQSENAPKSAQTAESNQAENTRKNDKATQKQNASVFHGFLKATDKHFSSSKFNSGTKADDARKEQLVTRQSQQMQDIFGEEYTKTEEKYKEEAKKAEATLQKIEKLETITGLCKHFGYSSLEQLKSAYKDVEGLEPIDFSPLEKRNYKKEDIQDIARKINDREKLLEEQKQEEIEKLIAQEQEEQDAIDAIIAASGENKEQVNLNELTEVYSNDSYAEEYREILRGQEPEKFALARTMFDNPSNAEQLLLQSCNGDVSKVAESLQSAFDSLGGDYYSGLFNDAEVSVDEQGNISINTSQFGKISFNSFVEQCKVLDIQNGLVVNQYKFISTIVSSDLELKIADTETAISNLTSTNTTIADDIKEGTELSKALYNAETKEDAYDVIYAHCGNNREVANRVYEYLIGYSSEETQNPYYQRENSSLLGKLYTNIGNKFVLNQDLLNAFAETEAYDYTIDATGNKTLLKRPTKEYYTNLSGELCTRTWDYAGEYPENYITISFKENDSTRDIEFYTSKNSIGETIYFIKPANEDDDPIAETQEEFFKRLAVAQNYSILNATNSSEMQFGSDMSTDSIERYYTILAQYDKNIAETLATISRQFSSEGILDDVRNWLSKAFNIGIDKDELLAEVGGGTLHTIIMSYYLNNQEDVAQELVNKELERRVNSADNFQEMYDTLLSYYGNKETALEILKNSVKLSEYNEYYPDFYFDDKGALKFTWFGLLHETLSCAASECSPEDFGFIGEDYKIEIIGTEYERKLSREEAYTFLSCNGEDTDENITAYNVASDNFTDYNTTIAPVEVLKECKNPEDAFCLITGKKIGVDIITDEDIQKFNDFYKIETAKQQEYLPDDLSPNYNTSGLSGGNDFVTYQLSIEYDKDNGFRVIYLGEDGITRPIEENSYYLPAEIRSYDVNALLQEINTNFGFADKLGTERFDEYYATNKEQADKYIEDFAEYVVSLDENSEEYRYFAKVLSEKYGTVTKENIIKYINSSNETRYNESCKFMQYAYTSSKQALFGESRLDNITNQYCMDMASYSSNLSHILSMGCMISSVFFPAAAPVLMMGAKMAGYTDNAIDLINMLSNRQNYMDDDYLGWAKSTGFEWLTKRGYKFFSDIAGDKAQKFIEWTVDKTKFGSFFATNAFAQILLRGSSEAVIETGICVPWTVLIKTIQGGEYDLLDELKENFIYDFLPYARGWQDMLNGTIKADLYLGGGRSYKLNDSETIVVEDENGKIKAVYSSVRDAQLDNGTEELAHAKVVYNYDEAGKTIITEYDESGNVKGKSIHENNGAKITYEDAKGQVYRTQTSEKNPTDGTIKITTTENGKPTVVETRDSKGRLKSVEQGNYTTEYDSKTGNKIKLTIKSPLNPSNPVEINYKKSWFGKQTASVEINGEKIEYTIDDNNIATLEIEGFKVCTDERNIQKALGNQVYSNNNLTTSLVQSLGYKLSLNSDGNIIAQVGKEKLPVDNIVYLSDSEVHYYDASGIPKVYNTETGEVTYPTLKQNEDYTKAVTAIGLDGNEIGYPLKWGGVISFQGVKNCSTLDEILNSKSVTQEEKAAIDNLYKRFQQAGDEYVKFIEERPDVFKAILGVSDASEGKLISVFEEMTDGEFAAVKHAIDAYTNGKISEEVSNAIWNRRLNMSIPYNFYDYIDSYEEIPEEGLASTMLPNRPLIPKEEAIEMLDEARKIISFLDTQLTELPMQVSRSDDIDSLFASTMIGDVSVAKLMENPTEENIEKVLAYFNGGKAEDITYKNILGTSLGSRPVFARKGSVVFDITVPEKSKGFFAGGALEKPIIDDEREFILQAGTKLQVEGATYEDGVLKIKATAITPESEDITITGNKSVESSAPDSEKPLFNEQQHNKAIESGYTSADADKIASAGLSDEQYDKLSLIREKYGDMSIDDAISVTKANLSEDQEEIFNTIYAVRKILNATPTDILDSLQVPLLKTAFDVIDFLTSAKTDNIPVSLLAKVYNNFDADRIPIAKNILSEYVKYGYDDVDIDKLAPLVEWGKQNSDNKDAPSLDEVVKRVAKYNIKPEPAAWLVGLELDDVLEGRVCLLCKAYSKYRLNSNEYIYLAKENLTPEQNDRIVQMHIKNAFPIQDCTMLEKANLSDEQCNRILQMNEEEKLPLSSCILIEKAGLSDEQKIQASSYVQDNGIPIEKAIEAAKNPEENAMYIDAFTCIRAMTDEKTGEPLFGDKIESQEIYERLKADGEDILEINGNYYLMNTSSITYFTERGSNNEVILDMVRQGYLSKRTLLSLPQQGEVNKFVNGDLDKICAAYYAQKPIEDAFVPKVTEDDLQKGEIILGSGEETEKLYLKPGDVVELDGHTRPCIINSDGSITELNMSKETYLKLFPPIERFANIQNQIGNCWECSGFNAVFRDSTTRHFILDMFSEDENGNITITYPSSGHSYTFEGGKLPDGTDMRYYSQGALAVQMLEWADGREIQSKRRDAFIVKGDLEKAQKEGLITIEDGEVKFADYAYVDKDGNISRYNGKYSNPYEESRRGGMSASFFSMIGMNAKSYMTSCGLDGLPQEVYNNIISEEFFKNNVVAIGTIPKPGSEPESVLDEEYGIISSHAYQLIPAEVKNGTITKYKILNPHGMVEVEIDADKLGKYVGTISYAPKGDGISDASVKSLQSDTQTAEAPSTYDEKIIAGVAEPEMQELILNLDDGEKVDLGEGVTIQKKDESILILRKEDDKIIEAKYIDENGKIIKIDSQNISETDKIDYTENGLILREYDSLGNITGVKYVNSNGKFTEVDIKTLVEKRIQAYQKELMDLESKGEKLPKHILTNDEILEATRISSELYVEYLQHEKEASDRSIDLFSGLDIVKNVSSRAKSENSAYSKLINFLQDEKASLDDIESCRIAIADAYGTRVQVKNLTPEENREVVENYLKDNKIDCTYEDYIAVLSGTADEETSKQIDNVRQREILHALKEKHTGAIVDTLVEGIKNGTIILADGKLNNYGNEESSYFTPKQLEKIADAYFDKTGRKLKIISLKEDGYSEKTSFEVKIIDDGEFELHESEKFTIQTKGSQKESGYATSQFKVMYKFDDGSIGYGEVQIRGTEVNAFGDVEHIPYDIKSGKLDGNDPKYEQMAYVLETMSDESRAQYDDAMKKIYAAQHSKELGIPIVKMPELPSTYTDKSGNTFDLLQYLSYDYLMNNFGHI